MSLISFSAASTPISYSYDASSDAGGVFTLTALVASLILIPITYAISSYLLMRIFRKANIEGWKAWVPVYNTWKTLEIGKQPGFWAVLLIIPLVNVIAVVFLSIAYYRIGLSLGKSGSFVLLAIFVPIVWLIWLAFDSSTWRGADIATNEAQSLTPPTFTPPTAPTNS